MCTDMLAVSKCVHSIVSPDSYTFFLTLLYQVAERMSYISIQSVPRVFSEVLVFLGIKPQYY